MIEQRVHGVLAAVHQVDDAGREAGLLDQLEDARHRHRRLLGRLEDDACCRRRRRRAGTRAESSPGKLNGVMAATTPTGWRIISSSMPEAMSSRLLPIISDGMPVATSTFSMPRCSSPSDSASVLPHSCVMSARDLGEVRVEQRLEPEERLDAVARRRAPPGRAAPPARRARPCRRRRADDSGASAMHFAGRRVVDRERVWHVGALPVSRRRSSTACLARSSMLPQRSSQCINLRPPDGQLRTFRSRF